MRVIERCQELCQKEMEKLRDKYHEAKASHNDTGYERYYKQMCKYEEQIEALEKYMNGDAIAKADASRYRRMYEEIHDSLYYVKKMVENLTDDDFTSPRVNEIINHLSRM